MKRTRKQADPWEGYEFIDINSRSGEEPPRPRTGPRQPASPRREARRTGRPPAGRPSSRSTRGQPTREPPRRERPQRGSPRGGSPPPGRRRPTQARERPAPRKPLSKGARLFLLAFTLVCMVAITAFLCVFLLFKVRTIEITGDMVYEQSAIMEVCGYQEGDNLALLSTKDRERDLEEQLPYVENAQILRHFPSGLEIHITAAKKTACISSGGQWYVVSGKGKILEALSQPAEGVMQVTGLTLADPQVGGQVQVQEAPKEESSTSEEGSSSQEEVQTNTAQTAFFEILQVVDQWNAGSEFISLDMTDLYRITMNFQNRILFELGSTSGLDYKVDYGLRLVYEEMDSNDMGTLDLTLSSEAKKAFFEASNSSLDSGSSAGGTDSSQEDGTQDGGETGGTDGSDDTSSGDETGEDTGSDGDGSSSQDRGGDIPDTIFRLTAAETTGFLAGGGGALVEFFHSL